MQLGLSFEVTPMGGHLPLKVRTLDDTLHLHISYYVFTPACDFVHRGEGVLYPGGCLSRGCLYPGRVSVQEGALCLAGGSLSRRGVSVQGALYPGGISVEETPPHTHGQLHAGGTHPTGMHFCLNYDFVYSLTIVIYVGSSHNTDRIYCRHKFLIGTESEFSLEIQVVFVQILVSYKTVKFKFLFHFHFCSV